MNAPGAFSTEFAKRKNWKLQESLVDAICTTIPAVSTVIELGAGIGRYVTELRRRGYVANGVDGIHDIEELSGGLIQWADLSQPLPLPKHLYSWCLSFEVGEHIPPRLASDYLDNVAKVSREGVICSWAVPGQRGRHHINCQPPEYVISEMTRRGWPMDVDATFAARQIAGKGWDKKLLVFRR